MPGLLNHITGTLDDIQAMMPDQASLMKTIRMPARMGQITERMPAPQYDEPTPTFKRTNSQPQLGQSTMETNDVGKKFQMLSANKARDVQLQPAPSGNRNAVGHMSSLNLGGNSPVEVESKSLIQKAHEMYNNSKVASG